MKIVPIRQRLYGLLLTLIAVFLIFVILPPSRDAMNGIVTVYNSNQAEGSLSPIKYKVIIDAQEVIELQTIANGTTNTYSIVGFDKCSIFNRTNWQCERSGNKFLMHDGNLTILKQNGEFLCQETKQINRLHWLFNRLIF